MTDAEQVVVQALLGFVQTPTCKQCRCELLRHQLVSYLMSVPVPLAQVLPEPDPDCPFCRIIQWALCEVLDPPALDCLQTELEAGNPLARIIHEGQCGLSFVGEGG